MHNSHCNARTVDSGEQNYSFLEGREKADVENKIPKRGIFPTNRMIQHVHYRCAQFPWLCFSEMKALITFLEGIVGSFSMLYHTASATWPWSTGTWTVLYRKPLTWKRNFSWMSLFKTNSPKWINFSTWVNNETFFCVRCMKPVKGENLTGFVTARRCRNHNSSPWGLHISRLTSSPSSLPRAVCDHSISSECCTAQSFRAASLSSDRKSLLARKAVNSLPLESNTEKLQFFPEWNSYSEGKKNSKGCKC